MATATHLGDMTIDEAAAVSAGNWRNFECFVWWREGELERPDDWMIHYTHHRDSGLLDQSNAEQIRQALASFTEGDDPDVVEESHSHWAAGYIDGFSLRVFKNGKITEAFRTFHRLMESLASYPILDEEDFSNREYEATVENIVDAAWRLAGPTRLRPILMTAFSTIAGMIPIALGLGDGAESRAPMGACVVGGMLTSTVLTLVVIPVVYSLIDDISIWLGNLFGIKQSDRRLESTDTQLANDPRPEGEIEETKVAPKLSHSAA